MALSITYSSASGIPALQLVGRVSDLDARDLSNELRNLCRRGHEKIVIDVSGVQFMDSHGLGVFVYYSTLLDKANRRLIFLNTNRNPTSYMNRLFEMTNLDRVLHRVDTVPVPENKRPHEGTKPHHRTGHAAHHRHDAVRADAPESA